MDSFEKAARSAENFSVFFKILTNFREISAKFCRIFAEFSQLGPGEMAAGHVRHVDDDFPPTVMRFYVLIHHPQLPADIQNQTAVILAFDAEICRRVVLIVSPQFEVIPKLSFIWP